MNGDRRLFARHASDFHNFRSFHLTRRYRRPLSFFVMRLTLLACIIFGLSCAGCQQLSKNNNINAKINDINWGETSPTELKSLLGEPRHIFKKENEIIWEYEINSESYLYVIISDNSICRADVSIWTRTKNIYNKSLEIPPSHNHSPE